MKEWSLGDKNKSLKFISPILGLDMEGNRLENVTYENFFQNPSRSELSNFLNCFIGDDVVNIEDKILMLYKFSGRIPFLEFEDWCTTHPLFEGKYDPDKSHVMFVFNIPEKVKADYELIKNGKYSRVSPFYRDLCVSFLKHENAVKDGKSSVYNIITKSETAFESLERELNKTKRDTEPFIKIPRDQEACSIMYRKEEYYQPEYVVRSALKGDYNNEQ